MKKTVKQFLEEIPDPEIRKRALQNMYSEYADEWSSSIPAAIARAFLWFKAPEKFKYWNKVYLDLGGTKHYTLKTTV